VGDEDALGAFLEEKGEGVEGTRGAHPGEAVRPQVHLRREVVAEALTDRRVDAIRCDDQVGIREVLRLRLPPELDLNAERPRTLVQQHQQGAAGAAAEAVAADAVRAALEVDLDVVPVGEGARDGAVGGLVRRLERVERGVGEDDAEAEGVVRLVALHHRDAGGREVPLHQDGEVEAGGAAADHGYAHGVPSLSCSEIV
jgi:hypothetical protein